MSFRDLQETAQAAALADKLQPDELSTWHRECREFSKRFFTPLEEVHKMDPYFVLSEVYADQLQEWDISERSEDIKDLIGSLNSPDYNIARERERREEDRKMVEEENERLKQNLPIHKSLKKDKSKFQEPKKELPKSGGINFDLINQLKNDEKAGGKF